MELIIPCYLPGRVYFLHEFDYELPLIVLVLLICHIVFRCLWYLLSDSFELECMLFLGYDREAILKKQFKLYELNDPKLPTEIAYKKYLCNETFYAQQASSRGRKVYFMKNHRTVEYFDRLKVVADALRITYFFIYTLTYLPMLTIGIYTLFSHESFEKNYKTCAPFSNSFNGKDFAWSFKDRYRLIRLILDGVDEVIIWTDTSLGLAVPFSGAIILTQDLNIRFD